jgi:hypothetical protein
LRYEQLVEEMSDGLPGQKDVGRNQLLYNDYANKKLGVMFYDGFEKFVNDHPRILWMAMQLQDKVRSRHLGEAYWLKKMAQFKYVREELGIETIN